MPRINRVDIVKGSDLKPGFWVRKMQIVYTSEGIFIDNAVGVKGSSGISWTAPDWSKKVGKLQDFGVVDNSGFLWIKDLSQ
ncbi:MAG: hypothetical protein DRQ78_09090 [Epsilonproteobacteria bacterium]|nr:MAG: hypothetical protein DRQ78_09090 [Campylobacterota bacterium]